MSLGSYFPLVANELGISLSRPVIWPLFLLLLSLHLQFLLASFLFNVPMLKAFRTSSVGPVILRASSGIVARSGGGTKSSGVSFLSGSKERRREVVAAAICGAEYGKNVNS